MEYFSNFFIACWSTAAKFPIKQAILSNIPSRPLHLPLHQIRRPKMVSHWNEGLSPTSSLLMLTSDRRVICISTPSGGKGSGERGGFEGDGDAGPSHYC